MTITSVTIHEKFRGPPSSGNGGYVSGVMAKILKDQGSLDASVAVEVTLRAPIPLDAPMEISLEGSLLSMRRGELLIAEARAADLQMEVPLPATREQALAAQPTSASLQMGMHPMIKEQRLGFHPICFCCGAELARDQGLHVYAAAIPGHSQVAAAWQCDPAFAAADNTIPEEIIWTALDCPGQFAWLAEGTRTGLLGRLTARIERTARADDRYVVIGWTMGSEGKKHFAGTALFNSAGERCAYAKAVWIGKWN
jgi:hypothetical protein